MNDCTENCPVLPRVEALEEENKQHRATHREMFDRLRDLEKTNAVQTAALDSINKKLDKLVEWQEDQRDKPGSLLDKMKEHALSLIVGGLIGYILVQLGLSM